MSDNKPTEPPPAGNNEAADSPLAAGATPIPFLSTAALTDWVMFLQGPSRPTFDMTLTNAEWKRVFRLGALVLLMLGAILVIFSLGLGPEGGKWQDLAAKTQYMLLILVVGAVLAVPYAFVLAPLLRIKITFAQTFFAILLLGLPWLPLIALIWALGRVWTNGIIVGIFLYILGLVPIVNFCKGVSIISGCSLRRVLVSLLIPAVLALTIFIANII
jgi:hypothetical protein